MCSAAQYGQGVVTCRTGHGWSAPVFIRMAGGSFGFQIGGQSTDLVLVAVNDRGFQDLLKNKFKIGGDASAAAGPVGRSGQAATDWKMNAELLSYSRNKGLFAGIDLDGTSVSQNEEDTDIYYGTPHHFETILKGDVAVPAGAVPFVRAVAHYFVAAKKHKERHEPRRCHGCRQGRRAVWTTVAVPFVLSGGLTADAARERLHWCLSYNDAGEDSSTGWWWPWRAPWGGCRAAWRARGCWVLAFTVYWAFGRLRRVGERNLEMALPEASAGERRRRFCAAFYRTLAGNWWSSAA